MRLKPHSTLRALLLSTAIGASAGCSALTSTWDRTQVALEDLSARVSAQEYSTNLTGVESRTFGDKDFNVHSKAVKLGDRNHLFAKLSGDDSVEVNGVIYGPEKIFDYVSFPTEIMVEDVDNLTNQVTYGLENGEAVVYLRYESPQGNKPIITTNQTAKRQEQQRKRLDVEVRESKFDVPYFILEGSDKRMYFITNAESMKDPLERKVGDLILTPNPVIRINHGRGYGNTALIQYLPRNDEIYFEARGKVLQKEGESLIPKKFYRQDIVTGKLEHLPVDVPSATNKE